jgi:hypothetical protein
LAALEVSQDRLTEKKLFATLDIRTAPYASGGFRTGFAFMRWRNSACLLILKTRRFGYDGKGQFVIRMKRYCDSMANAGQCVVDTGRLCQIFPRSIHYRSAWKRWRNSFLSAFRKCTSQRHFVHIACPALADAMQAAG